ncbi:MAG: hypothetical protein AB1798_12700 [Spirochaetota bacterium]
MKRAFSLFFLFACACLGLYAEAGYVLKRIVLLPPEFYVGDRVELRIRIFPEAGKKVSDLESLPDVSWIKIHSVTVLPYGNETEIRISFSPYSTGVRTLPALKLGDIILDNIKIKTDSLLEGKKISFKGLREQKLLPGTRLYLLLFVGLIPAAALISIPISRAGSRVFRKIAARYRKKKPLRIFQKAMVSLQEDLGRLEGRDFYAFLSKELKRYLSAKTDIGCMCKTTREIEEQLLKTCLDQPLYTQFLSLFSFGDVVKFGGRDVSLAKKRQDVEAALTAASSFELLFSKQISREETGVDI